MLNPNSDRLDYGQILAPPAGYDLDLAVGTTYSLDLETLTAVSIALGLKEDMDSDLLRNPISMLNALQKVTEKILIFCEVGQMKASDKASPLMILMEKMVIPVALPKGRKGAAYPSFHPKTWVLRYVNSEGEKRYRFVVLSRNLTFDRSWDISFCMDSSLQSFTISLRVRWVMVQNRNRMHDADSSALMVFTIRATCVGSLTNCEKRLAVSMKNGAPGG